MTDPIRKVVEEYYRAMVSGDGPAIGRLFDPEARFQGWRDGAEVRRDLPAFIAVVETPDAPGDREEWAVAFTHRTGPIAVVRVVDRFRGRYYTDYLTLAETQGGWVIVNKCFYAHPPETETLAEAVGALGR
ncbi:nuclear transport factor 2 family protein [Sphingosinicella microcystinivorans]|uniref:nuclear transport factor 2 family protein n=1 Tax=Sphingosinicella microcystinivorans TaxID=335406 RepID=UPI0022F3FA1D|nr:nuclear transport factor 2 family protein [Sphingosinicella microcystinivorans]WBX85322.1 nuclear transport factor 2 family protein [Sphingosinicella microcystinivorans]